MGDLWTGFKWEWGRGVGGGAMLRIESRDQVSGLRSVKYV